ncbi:hypothetical protein DH2020_022472 [Rehmannia glutinosa]|uniref:G-type lectin S-receptor-like serine/threonine-protein kinase n=1 Tax=Rehmannia glutinosa TaxID=99300 RepID=A0ABR0WDG6_REHGL
MGLFGWTGWVRSVGPWAFNFALWPGFEPENKQEWDSGNWTSGCVRKIPLNCRGNNNISTSNNGSREDGFLKIQSIKVPGYSTRWFGPEKECPGLCLMNCSCIAYAHDSDLGCMFWNSTLFDIQKFPIGLSSSDLYFRVANSELGKRRAIVLGKAGASDSVDSSFQDELSKLNLEEFPLFKFEMLENATDGFSNANKLGKGGFGLVYKGELANKREIAVKRLSRASGQGMHEFMNEVVLISKLQHRNLVRLMGCCVENNEKMLIYEYMPNKSLDFFLFDFYVTRFSCSGYMAPEYAIEGKFSEKSDVFSFGVMMLEIVSGRRNTSFYNHQSSVNLLGHVWKLWNEDNIGASIDVRISSPSHRTEVVRCIHIGLLCVQELPKDRPSISAVLSMLNSEIAELPEPKQIAFALNSSRCNNNNAGASSSQPSQKSSGSLNNVTLSVVDGR